MKNKQTHDSSKIAPIYEHKGFNSQSFKKIIQLTFNICYKEKQNVTNFYCSSFDWLPKIPFAGFALELEDGAVRSLRHWQLFRWQVVLVWRFVVEAGQPAAACLLAAFIVASLDWKLLLAEGFEWQLPLRWAEKQTSGGWTPPLMEWVNGPQTLMQSI